MTQLITERILNNIGGTALVDAYREKYVKGYVSSSGIAKIGMFSQGVQRETQELTKGSSLSNPSSINRQSNR